MGKYVQTALHSALTNKLGNVVYYKHKKGISYRAVSVKAQTPSTDRTRVRGYLKTSAAAWNATLTQPQRAAWNTAAAAADFRMNRRPRGRLSGWQMFHRANLTLLNIGKPILAAPVQISAPDPVTSFSIDTLDATTQTIKLAIAGGSRVNTHLIIYATGNREIDQLADQRWTRQVAVIPPGWTSPVDISSDWTTKFGTLNGSVRVAFAVATADDRDGQLSARQFTAGISTGSSAVASLIGRITPATIVPPVLANLTWVFQGTATAVTNSGPALFVSDHTGTGNNTYECLTQAAPATPYSAIMGFIPWFGIGITGSNNGLILRESSTGKFVVCEVSINSANLVHAVVYFSAPSNDSAYPLISANGGTTGGAMIWLKVTDDGTNLVFSSSPDGQSWTQVWSASRTAWLATGPNQVGFGIQPPHPSGALVVHFQAA